MNKYLFGAALGLSLLAVPGPGYGQQRTAAAVIVLVDSGRILQQCLACRAAQVQIQALFTSTQQRQQQLAGPLEAEAQSVQAVAQAVQAMPGGADRTAATLALHQRAQALEDRQYAANQEMERLQQNLQSVRANVSQQLNVRLLPIVSQVMTAHGASFAVDRDAVLAHVPAVDVTNEVLAELDRQLWSVSATPMTRQALPEQPQGR